MCAVMVVRGRGGGLSQRYQYGAQTDMCVSYASRHGVADSKQPFGNLCRLDASVGFQQRAPWAPYVGPESEAMQPMSRLILLFLQ